MNIFFISVYWFWFVVAIVLVHIPTTIVFFLYWAARYTWDVLDKQQDRWIAAVHARSSLRHKRQATKDA